MNDLLMTSRQELLHYNCMGRRRLTAFLCFSSNLRLLTLKAVAAADPRRLNPVSTEPESEGLSSFRASQVSSSRRAQCPKSLAPD